MRFAFISAEKAHFPVQVLCDVLEVSRSGFYAFEKRPPSAHAQRDEALRVKVRAIHLKSKRRYGGPRVFNALKQQGEATSHKRVARLMAEEKLVARKVRKFVATTDSKHSFEVPGNVLARDFTAKAPNEKWVGDITYLRTAEGWLYLAVILDCFSRAVVGWAVRETLESELATAALKQALALRRPSKGLVFHSDRGVQYASDDYVRVLKGAQATPSMSRKGNCWDNAVSESFFSSLKFELDAPLDGSASKVEVNEAVREYVLFYNYERLHSTIGYSAPISYEVTARMGLAA